MEIGFEKGVQAVNIVAVAGYLQGESQHAVGREDEMFLYTVEITLQGGAISELRETSEACFSSGANRPAYVHRVGVYDKKGASDSH